MGQRVFGGTWVGRFLCDLEEEEEEEDGGEEGDEECSNLGVEDTDKGDAG